MRRRDFLGAAATASLAAWTAPAAAIGAETSDYRFKLGMYLGELDLPFDESLATAKEIGAEYVWFNTLKGETPIGRMSDAEVDRLAQRVAHHNLKIFLLNAGNPFKEIHLTDLKVENPESNSDFSKQLADLTRSMAVAQRIGVSAVGCFTFAWPGEYTAGKPTWPMRWATRGGIISELDLDKLVRAFSLVLERAERYNVDVALSQMPWNYTNTTTNFRRLAEKLGSKRIKVMWGPADNWNSGECDVATAGFQNVRPFLHGLHLKNLHVTDGPRLKFDYKPLGEGDVDYVAILKQLRDHRSDAILSVSTHFRPPSGDRVEAMRINYRNLRDLISKVETG
jgi:sugar phosphate isomerase/epimerase